ncbi:putative phd finger and bah domain protein [Eutypa lata UCREL1]|uniref:Putative phd finger and bah domain protein n=1 Tax=Eutypa lata (strain UCR-EL1) TaxID=1287681 RepID=M7S7R2_EUTLA|nr:putative phd finger and bah domain protein [Eutypa lata UCREL1]
MHSDTSPLHSLRGKCQIRHKAEIENMDAYRKTPDCFWFEKLYDRYIQKYYEVIPCFQIVNVPEKVKKVLDERWKYIIVEQGRSKEFTSAVKLYVEEEEYWDEEDDGVDTCGTGSADGVDDSHQPATKEQLYQASQWPYRYLGMHCKPEDALDYDDRIYPRAGSRLGPKHQATVLPWPGKAVKLVKPLEIKKIGKKDSKQAKEAHAALEAERIAREKRPKWIQDEPPGYVHRGEDLPNDDPDNTAVLLWVPPKDASSSITDSEIDTYVSEARAEAIPAFNLPEESTNLRDIATQTLYKNKFNTKVSLKELLKVDKSEFKEPDLTPAEIKKFEEGVSKFGSELYPTTKHVKTVEHRRIVRFYYTWKKTQRGKQIWGNFATRKGKKEAKIAEANANKLQDDVADGHDDSAFDTEKALERKRTFMCKFCSTKSSRQWRRAPAGGPVFLTEGGGKNKDRIQHIAALCRRCAELWRRYAIQWEDLEDLAKKVAAAGGRSWKRRVDEELLKELTAANEMMSMTVYNTPTPTATQASAVATPTQPVSTETQQPRKKLKTSATKDIEPHSPKSDASASHAQPKKKEKAEKNPQVSIEYNCVLCPVEFTEHDFVEPPKNTHKKKTEKEREKERIEREAAQKAAEYWLFTPEVKFGNAKALSPSEGIPSIPRLATIVVLLNVPIRMATSLDSKLHQLKALGEINITL